LAEYGAASTGPSNRGEGLPWVQKAGMRKVRGILVMGFLLPLFVAATERGPEDPSKPEATLVWKQRSWQ
jgi:hypothetical protein